MKFTSKFGGRLRRRNRGGFESYTVPDAEADMSFFGAAGCTSNEQLIHCRVKTRWILTTTAGEGICGSCGGDDQRPGPRWATPNGDLPAIPAAFSGWRRKLLWKTLAGRAGISGPLKTWVVDRSALTALIMAGGYVSVKTGSAPDANGHPPNFSPTSPGMQI